MGSSLKMPDLFKLINSRAAARPTFCPHVNATRTAVADELMMATDGISHRGAILMSATRETNEQILGN